MGLAWARLPGGLTGYIDPSGEWAIEPQFFVAYDFQPCGVAMFRELRSNGWDAYGFVNLSGQIIKEAQFGDARDYVGGYTIVGNERWFSRLLRPIRLEGMGIPVWAHYQILDAEGRPTRLPPSQ